MSFLNDNKKLPIEVDVTVDAEAASFLSGDIEFSKDDIEESKKMFYRETQLTQGLNSRLIGMIALVGIFGTGLFLSSGGTLATAGPVGMLLSYIFVGLILIANQVSALEVLTLCPVTLGNILQSSYFLDKAVAFALGYVNLYSSIIPGELAAASVVVSYWTDINPAVFISVFIVVIIAVNSYNVRWYGEVEFGFGILKLSLVLGLILVGLVIDLGGAPNHERLGFRYWKDPGPFAERYATGSLGKFLAFWKCVSSTVYSFGGAQSSAFFAGETQYPRRAINRAMKRIMVRVLFFYWVAVFILSLIVPYNDEKIASPNGTASGSAWVIAVERSGIKVLPHIINAIVMTSALSAANLGLIGSSRTLYSLASNGQAPKIFLKVNKHGLPWVGVVLAAACLPLAYLSVSEVTGTVFSWFQSITAANLLLNWMIYAANHISMNRALKAQGLSRNDLPYTVRGGQYAGPVSFFFCFIIFFTSGFAVFLNGNWAFANFFSSYFIIPLFIGLFIFGKLWFKTSFIKPEGVPIRAMLYDVQARPEPPYEKLRGWKIITVLWS